MFNLATPGSLTSGDYTPGDYATDYITDYVTDYITDYIPPRSEKFCMTLPSELAMNIRIIKALGDSTLEGPVKHFVISSILKKMKKPNIITGDMFWRFLSTYYNITGEVDLPEAAEQRDFRLEEHIKLERAAK